MPTIAADYLKITEDLRFEEYKALCRNATKDSIRQAVRLVANSARGNVPVSKKHRVRRSYPRQKTLMRKDAKRGRTGQKVKMPSEFYNEPMHLRSTIRTSVKDKGDRGITGMIRSIYGYSIFVEWGTKFQAAHSFLRKARSENMDNVMQILKGNWPK